MRQEILTHSFPLENFPSPNWALPQYLINLAVLGTGEESHGLIIMLHRERAITTPFVKTQGQKGII